MINDAPDNTTPLPEVAVVILNWNGKKFLEQFLPSVTQSSYGNKRIIVADNASTDDSIAFVRQNYPAIEIIQNKNNEGFAGGYNTALKQVSSDYYVLLNSDVEVTPGWIEPVIALMQQDTTIGACQPKLLAFHDTTQFEYAGACGGWIDKFGYPFARGRVFDNCEKDRGQYNDPAECFWASGAALFIRAKLYHELGGLDEYFFAHQEEIDLCWRIKLSGYKVYVQPASVVYHVGGGTLPKGNNKKTYLNFRNNLIMMYKNLPVAERLKKIPFRFLLDAVAAWKALLGGDGGYFFAVLKAHVHVLGWIFSDQKRSLFVKSKQPVITGMYNGSIVWDHFVKKKNSFLEILGRKKD